VPGLSARKIFFCFCFFAFLLFCYLGFLKLDLADDISPWTSKKIILWESLAMISRYIYSGQKTQNRILIYIAYYCKRFMRILMQSNSYNIYQTQIWHIFYGFWTFGTPLTLKGPDVLDESAGGMVEISWNPGTLVNLIK
jgi:hypothetical protein